MTGKDKILEQLSAYIDGELTEPERKEVEKLIETDPHLAAELRNIQTVRNMLRDLPRQRPGEDFVSGVLSQAERRRLISSSPDQHAPGGMRWVRWLASAAVLLIAVGIGTVVAVFLHHPDWSETIAQTEKPQIESKLVRDVSELTEKKLPPRKETVGGKALAVAPVEEAPGVTRPIEAARGEPPSRVDALAVVEEAVKEERQPKTVADEESRAKRAPRPALVPSIPPAIEARDELKEVAADAARTVTAERPPEPRTTGEHIGRDALRGAGPSLDAPEPLESSELEEKVTEPEPAEAPSPPAAMAPSPAAGISPAVPEARMKAPPSALVPLDKSVVTDGQRSESKVRLELAEKPSPQGGPELRIRPVPPADAEKAVVLDRRGDRYFALDDTAPRGRVATRPVESEEGILPGELAGAFNETVYSDDLEAAQEQVKDLLVANNVLPLVIGDHAAADADRLRWGKLARVANFTQLAQRKRDRVQYVAYVDSKQLKSITSGLRFIRDSQGVSQLPPLETEPELAGPPRAGFVPPGSAGTTRPAAPPKGWIAVEEIGGSLQLTRGDRRRGRGPARTYAAAGHPKGVGEIQLLLITLDYREPERTDASAPERNKEAK